MSAKTPSTDKAVGLTQEALDAAESNLQEMEKRARQTLEEATKQAEQLKAKTNAQVSKSVDTIESYVKENPLQAAGIAFFAGVFAASVLSRK